MAVPPDCFAGNLLKQQDCLNRNNQVSGNKKQVAGKSNQL